MSVRLESQRVSASYFDFQTKLMSERVVLPEPLPPSATGIPSCPRAVHVLR
jgi:hypothetical protein